MAHLDSDKIVSVVVPTRNSARTLGALLNSLSSQSCSPLETLVVDNFSTDQTGDVADAYNAKVLLKGPERSAQRNFGARFARGRYLLFLDSDMELVPGALENYLAVANGGAEAVVIPEETLGVGLLCEMRRWERSLIQRELQLTSARFLSATLFRSVGGYDEAITGFEDLDMQAKLLERGVTIRSAQVPILHHEENLTVREYLAKRRYYQRTSNLYKAKHPKVAGEVFSTRKRLSLYINGIHTSRDFFRASLSATMRLAEILGQPRRQD